MNTASGSSRSQAGSEDSPSTSSTVVDMLRLLDRMDDLLINSCREARTSLGNPDTFPVTNDDFLLLADAKRRYQEANYSLEEVSLYLLRLRALDETWENVCRGISRHFDNVPSRAREWRLWLKQVERAGSEAWKKALNAAYFISTTFEEDRLAMILGLIHKFAVVDELLEEIHRELYGREREVRFSAELNDSIMAIIAIKEQGSEVTPETLLQFRSAIRMQRAAAEAQWTGAHQEPTAGDPDRLRRRRIVLDREPVEDRHDGAEGQVIPPRRSEADASHQGHAMSQVHRIGFTRLDGGDDANGQRRCNIIFVHGLRGHPERTWAETPDETNPTKPFSLLSSAFQTLSLGRKAREASTAAPEASHRRPFWPRDLLAGDLPEARVWTYGYNADVIDAGAGANNQNSVSQHGRDLAIKAERELEDAVGAGQEPIIFVAHSLGGIIVKDALFRSETLQQRTTSVVFLGTPHRGSSAADWAQMASNLAAVALLDSNKKLVGALRMDGEVLANIHEQFIKIVTQRSIRIHSFQEARGMTGVRGFSGKVVGDFSSLVGLHDEKTESIDADHRHMVKSVDRDDARYRAIFSVLRRFVRQAVGSEGSSPPQPLNLEDTRETPSGIPARTEVRFLVPFQRIKKFVGREDALQDVRHSLFDVDGPQTVAIVGLGGVGKTQVALQMAYWAKEHKPECSVFWLPALSMPAFDQACAELARELELERPDKEDPKELLRRYLESARSGDWLLIVDNADDRHTMLGNAEPPGLRCHLPKSAHGRLLFTTRSMDVALAVADDNVVELAEMTEGEAQDLLKALLSIMPGDEDSAAALLRELTYLPLAISQAAAYIKRNKTRIPKYLSLLRKTQKEAIGLLSREFPDQNRYEASQHVVATTWLVSFEQIRRDDRPAADLLSFMSQVEPRAIPQSLLPMPGTEEELVHAVGTLKGYAFLQEREDAETFDMHRPVHLATRGWIYEGGTAQQVRMSAVAHAAAVFRTDDWEQRERWTRQMPHVLKLIKEDASEANWDADECNLGYWTGRCLRAEGRVPEAVKMLKHVVEVQEKTLAEDHPSRLASQHALAGAYEANGQVKEAVKILEHVVEVEAETLAEDHPSRLASQHTLAEAYRAEGRAKEAVSLIPIQQPDFGDRDVSKDCATEDPSEAWEYRYPYPYTLTEYVDNFLAMLDCPWFTLPISKGTTRVSWHCGCGTLHHEDYPEGSTMIRQASDIMPQGDVTVRQGQQGLSNQTLSSFFSFLERAAAGIASAFSKQKSSTNQDEELGEVSPGTTTLQTEPPGEQEVGQRLKLLLCIDRGRLHTQLHQVTLVGVSDDKRLFQFLRNTYYTERQISKFALWSLSSLSLTRFEVDHNNYADIHYHGKELCENECICIPDKTRAETDYSCEPAPAKDPESKPALSSRKLTYYFTDPKCLKRMQNSTLKQIPKLKDELRTYSNGTTIGWGIHFKEDWHWRTLGLFMAVLLALSLIFGITWCICTGDVSSAFAVTAAGFTLVSVLIGGFTLAFNL